MQGVCSDAASFDLTGALLATAQQEVLAALEVALLKRDGEEQVSRPSPIVMQTSQLLLSMINLAGICTISWCAYG